MTIIYDPNLIQKMHTLAYYKDSYKIIIKMYCISDLLQLTIKMFYISDLLQLTIKMFYISDLSENCN